MAVLPVPGGDVGAWGVEMNAWLLTAHNADGTLKAGALPETAAGAPVAGTFAAGDVNVDRTGQVWVCVVAGTPGTWTCATKSRQQIAASAAGVLTENFHPSGAGGQTACVSQTVYGVLLGLRAGDVVTGVMLRNAIAAAGTLPTTARFGLADSTGKILALSGNDNALALWVQGANPHAFTAPYTVLADGSYYACFVVNGVFGTTVPLPLRGLNLGGGNGGTQAAPGAAAPAFSWTAQADLPAVNSPLTLAAPILIGFYMGFY